MLRKDTITKLLDMFDQALELEVSSSTADADAGSIVVEAITEALGGSKTLASLLQARAATDGDNRRSVGNFRHAEYADVEQLQALREVH